MGIRKIIVTAWRYSWLATVPLAAATLAWLLPVWRDTRQFVVYHPASMHRSSDIDLNLRQIALSRLAGIKADLLSSWQSRWVTVTPALPVIDLHVSSGALAVLDAYLPKSGKENWVAAKVRFPGGDLDNVSVRYRGDSLHHWGLAAKSWLLRTPKTQLIDGSRRWHFVLPRWRSVGNYYVNLHMAEKMGILAPNPKLVSLRVNGRQHGGIHLLFTPEDETFLRQHNRLPGDLYVGDMSTMDDGFAQERPIAGLWELPWLWQKASFDGSFDPDSRLPLEILFQRIYKGTPEALAEILDLPAWARFAAYMQLFDASHMDMGHNWKLYYNPGKLTFEPVVGDGNGLPDEINDLTEGVPGLDTSVTTPLLARLHQDHEFLRLKNEALVRFFSTKLDKAFFKELDGFVAKAAPTLDLYPQIDWMGTVDGAPLHYFTGADLRARAERVKPELQRWFDAQRQLATLQAANVQISPLPDQTLRIQIDGYAGAKVSLPPSTNAPSATLTTFDQSGRPKAADVSDRLRPTPDGRWLLDLTLLAARQVTSPKEGTHSGLHEVKPATYDLRFSNSTIAAGDLELVGLLGERVRPVAAATLTPARFATDNVNVIPAKSAPLQWNGTMEIEGLREITGDLMLAPGTRLRMAPGASLIVRGRLLAAGTAAQPIVVERKDPAAAWGTLAVIGPRSDHTTLRFCRISGGSGRNTPLKIFPGSVSILNAQGVTIEDCQFSQDSGFDSLLHSSNSEIVIRRSTFTDAYRNAIDVELCRGRLELVLVDRVGKDALSVVNSDVTVFSSQFRHSRDKGIYAGQKSQVAVFNSEIAENKIGVSTGDGSEVVIYNSLLQNNQTQLEGYQKNFSYPNPATTVLAKSRVVGGDKIYSLKDTATVTLQDSQAPEQLYVSRLKRDALSDLAAAAKSSAPAASYEQLPTGHRWPAARHDRRGLADPTALPTTPLFRQP